MKFFSKSESCSGPGFRTVVERHYRATFGRFQFALHVTTKEALKLREASAKYQALKAKAMGVAGDDSVWVEWGLDDIWNGPGGHPRRETAVSYLESIIETGVVPNAPEGGIEQPPLIA